MPTLVIENVPPPLYDRIQRLALARKQQEQKGRFNYAIVNDDVERAAKQLAEIVRSELQAAGTMSRP